MTKVPKVRARTRQLVNDCAVTRGNVMAEVGVQNLGQIEKLIGRENYGTWKFAMRACLEAEDLWGCVLGKEAYVTDMKKMTKARAKIVLAVQKQNYGHIQSANTPRKAWENLKNAFEDKGLTRKVGLLRILTPSCKIAIPWRST